MEFLKDEFLDQLRAEIDDTTGNVLIEAAQFTPQKILEFNSETFDMAFDEWCENKRQERLEKANEILGLYDNQRRFEVLKASYNRGAVIPFIGAGMSMPCGYSGWTEYLREILKETRLNPQDLEALLSDSKYEEAAQLLFDSMPAGSFNESLENTFGHDLTLSGAVRYLPYIFTSSGVITTNFDNVLKRIYEEAQEHFAEILLGSDALEFPRLLGAGKNILVKLHGKATSSKNRVLTFEEYNTHYADDGSLQNCIKAISNKTLIFLGCSLGADRTVQCLKDILEAQGTEATPRHYAFLAVADNDERLARRDILVESNIHPIWYSSDEDHDECIMALLEKLKEDV